ncbi:hypothetical protein [Brevundimonas sp.]|uniref:hypothetical protein n=1 Tax=Brevundimonas sp. TaxID=1871086 RepID=UPI002D4A6F52|nr:hypothetical protein [Brevundimonas sp.]HYD27269.1 hypothetical protein [Brevundimonas sp.]
MLKSRGRRRRWLLAAGGSIGLHLALLAVIVLVRPPTASPILFEPADEPVEVTLFRPPPPPPPPEVRGEAPAEEGAAAPPDAAPPAPEPPAPPSPAPPRPAPRAARVVAPPPPAVEPLPAAVAAPAPVFASLGEAQLAGAATAGSGSGQGAGAGQGSGQGAGSGAGGDGAGCDMIRRLQEALRADPEVRAAVAQAHRQVGPGRALLVWDGDWIQTPGQAGKGLAGVRQAIALEVAFAPEACRRQSMRGLVLITFAGGQRVVFGTGSWRWSQMLGSR